MNATNAARVQQLCASNGAVTADEEMKLCGRQHPERRPQKIDPEVLPHHPRNGGS